MLIHQSCDIWDQKRFVVYSAVPKSVPQLLDVKVLSLNVEISWQGQSVQDHLRRHGVRVHSHWHSPG